MSTEEGRKEAQLTLALAVDVDVDERRKETQLTLALAIDDDVVGGRKKGSPADAGAGRRR